MAKTRIKTCDHCGTPAKRRYAVRITKRGRTSVVMVGSSCAKSFPRANQSDLIRSLRNPENSYRSENADNVFTKEAIAEIEEVGLSPNLMIKYGTKEFMLKAAAVIFDLVGQSTARIGKQAVLDKLLGIISGELPGPAWLFAPTRLTPTGISQKLPVKGLTPNDIGEIVQWMTFSTGVKHGLMRMAVLGEWAAYGFPSIRTGHKFASAKLVSRASKEDLPFARPPFNSFFIELPDGLIVMEDPMAKTGFSKISRVLVNYSDGKWTWVTWASTGTEMYRLNVTTEQMVGPAEATLSDEVYNIEMSNSDIRLTNAISRFIIHMCLTMGGDPTAVKEVGGAHEKWRRQQSEPRRYGVIDPVVRDFYVGKDVTRDFRKVVSDYIRGTGKKLEYQMVVSGYYRQQPHGEKSSLRRLQWIEPYWKGDPEARIPIREIKVNEKPGKPDRASSKSAKTAKPIVDICLDPGAFLGRWLHSRKSAISKTSIAYWAKKYPYTGRAFRADNAKPTDKPLGSWCKTPGGLSAWKQHVYPPLGFADGVFNYIGHIEQGIDLAAMAKGEGLTDQFKDTIIAVEEVTPTVTVTDIRRI